MSDPLFGGIEVALSSFSNVTVLGAATNKHFTLDKVISLTDSLVELLERHMGEKCFFIVIPILGHRYGFVGKAQIIDREMIKHIKATVASFMQAELIKEN